LDFKEVIRETGYMSTIKDIAKVAGVSVTTVSRALNGYSDVSEKTRKKIKRIAEELKYSPNTVARSLVTNKTKTIGLLVSGISREGAKDNIVLKVLTGVNEYCGEVGYDIILLNTSSRKQMEKTYTQLCRERRVDGVIIQGIKREDPYLLEVVESDIPCVLVDIPIESSTVGYVTTDNVSGSIKAVQHLIDLGHKEIGMINGHDQAFVSQERLKGYEKALQDNNLALNKEHVVNGYFEEESARIAALKLLKEQPQLTSLFCASDLMAFGAIKAAKELGLKVPEDFSVIGFDDIILASYASPSLSTVSQDMFKVGSESARLLIDILEGKQEGRNIVISNELILRESTRYLKRI
jgi:LacI family transcriptional regulator